jgi:hypothetical protein
VLTHATLMARNLLQDLPGAIPADGRELVAYLRQLPPYALGAGIAGLVLAWMAIAWVPMLTLTAWWSGWRRLAALYPDRNSERRRSFGCGPMVMGMANYRGGARLTPDDLHLHFSVWALFRPGHPPFSVPWSDITATRDEWPWFPLRGDPIVRLTLGRYPTLRILVPRSDGERIVAASDGRLTLREPPAPLAAGR